MIDCVFIVQVKQKVEWFQQHIEDINTLRLQLEGSDTTNTIVGIINTIVRVIGVVITIVRIINTCSPSNFCTRW